MWQYGARDRVALQPDVLYQNCAMPPSSTPDKPVDCVLTKFVRAAMNKVKCPIYSICVRLLHYLSVVVFVAFIEGGSSHA